MSRQIIKQPNGKYCIFSTIVDNILSTDMSVEDIREFFINDAKESINKTIDKVVDDLENGRKTYHQFTKSFDDAISIIKQVHGKKEAESIKSSIGNVQPTEEGINMVDIILKPAELGDIEGSDFSPKKSITTRYIKTNE